MFFPGHISTVALVVLVAVLAAYTAVAQQRIMPAIGIVGGIERGIIRGHFPIYGGTPGCGEFTSGRSSGSWIGASFSMPLPQENLGASFRLGWLRTENLFTGLAADTLWVYDPALRSDVMADREFRHSVISNAIVLELLTTWRVADGFSLAIGPQIGYRLSTEITQSTHLIDAGGLIFTGEGEISRMGSGEILTPQPLMLGATVSGWYEIPLGTRLRLAAELSASANIISAMREMQWLPLTVRAGLGIRFDLTSRRSPLARIDAIPPDTSGPGAATLDGRPALSLMDTSAGRIIPKESDSAFGLGASIRIFGVDKRGERTPATTVHAIETVRRRKVLLHDGISAGGDTLLVARGLLRSQDDADRFAIDSLRDLDAPSIQMHLLNIIGERMRRFPAARISLNAHTRGELTNQRAEAIRNYLAGTWRIDPARIAILLPSPDAAYTTDPLPGENTDEIMISSETPQILEPLTFERSDRDFTAPILTLEPLYQSDTGIRHWDIVLAHQGTAVARYSSLTPEDHETTFDWQPVYGQLTNDSTVLTAIFSIEDKRGERLTVQSQVPLLVRRHRRIIEQTTRMVDGYRETLYILPPADSSAPEPAHAMIAEIVESIQERSTVEIIGITGGTASARDAEITRFMTTVLGGIQATHGRRIHAPAGMPLTRLVPVEAGFGGSMLEPGSIAVVVRTDR